MVIGFIGAGNMAGAIIRGVCTQGITPGDIYITDLDENKTAALAAQCGVQVCGNNESLAEKADYLVLAVKPHLLKPVLAPLRQILEKRRPVLVSIAAGITLPMLEDFAGVANLPIIRVMPNVNVAVQQGMSAVCGNAHAGKDKLDFILSMFSKVGQATLLEEQFFGLFGALAGSSPAFSYLFIESLAKAAHKAGMPKEQAVKIAAQAVLGSAATILASQEHPWTLIDMVCSPGGTTIEGICSLEKSGFSTAVVDCIDACMEKDALIQRKNQ